MNKLLDLRKSLVLVGMMGAGKTSVGRILAGKLALPFIDADAEIEAAMADNLCRCGTYQRIMQAIRLASSKIQQA